MSKFEKLSLDTLRNDSTAVGIINQNFEKLEALLENMLSRDGQSPNTMNDLLDMNQNRLVNLPLPLSPQEPVRLGDVTEVTEDLEELMNEAAASLAEAVATADSIIPEAEAARDAAQGYATAASASVSEASTFASTAATQATNAANSAASFVGSSSTSLAIGTGTKVFTTQSGKSFSNGALLLISRSGGADYMYGQVSSYSSTTLTMNITATSGSGTYTDWIISVSGIPGPTGPQGSAGAVGPGGGDVAGPASAVNNQVVYFDGTTGKLLKDSGVTLGSLASLSTINDGNWSGTDLSMANGGTGTTLTDPNADRILFWDDSAGAMTWLTASTGLVVSGTTLTVSVDKTSVGLANVDNTTDLNKPVSTATQTALDLKLTKGQAYTELSTKAGSFTVPFSDFGKLINMTASGTITVPTTASAAFPVGTVLSVWVNAGLTVTVVGASGVSVSAPFGSKIMAGGLGSIVKIADALWCLQGATST